MDREQSMNQLYKNYDNVNDIGKFLIRSINRMLIPFKFIAYFFIKKYYEIFQRDVNGNIFASIIINNIVYTTYYAGNKRQYTKQYNVFHPKNSDYEENR